MKDDLKLFKRDVIGFFKTKSPEGEVCVLIEAKDIPNIAQKENKNTQRSIEAQLFRINCLVRSPIRSIHIK
jgi:hypothetical protein